jgi:glycogen debranching enzyme
MNNIFLSLILGCLFCSKAYSSSIPDALKIATQGLKQNVIKVSKDHHYIVAGATQYRSLWAWDFAFASFGAMKIGEAQAVRDSLAIFYDNQRADGLLPRILDHHRLEFRVPLGMIGIILDFKDPLIAQYKTENGVVSFIPNAMFGWTASRYILETQDRAFASKYFSRAEKAIQWLDQFHEKGLVCKQEPYSDWEDSVQRTGCVSFTNILYAYSLRGLADWAKFLGDSKKETFYLERYEKFKISFQNMFWDKEKHVFKNFTGDDHLTADTNLLAVAYGLVDQVQGEEIMKTLRQSPLWIPYPGRPTSPEYPNSMKSYYPRLTGLAGYHDVIRWGWLTALAAMAEKKMGREDLSTQILEQYSQQVMADGIVCEVYDYDEEKKSVTPVKRLIYKSERPFSWSSGMFIEAAL